MVKGGGRDGEKGEGEQVFTEGQLCTGTTLSTFGVSFRESPGNPVLQRCPQLCFTPGDTACPKLRSNLPREGTRREG